MVSENIFEKKSFSRLGIILAGIILSICFVYAITYEIIVSPKNVNDTLSYSYNFTINNTNVTTGNITRVEIIFDTNFTFIANTNGSSLGANVTIVSNKLTWAGFNISNKTTAYFWINATVAIANTYNVTINLTDNYGGNFTNSSLQIVVNDTVVPVSILNGPANHTYNNGSTITFNCSATDTKALSTLRLFIWNSTGGMYSNNSTVISGVSNTTTWLHTLNTTSPHVNYTWNCVSNDTVNNVDWANNYTIFIDTTSPSGMTISSSSATTTSLTLVTSGTDGACTVSRGTLSGNTITETGLTCGTSYSYTLTCVDAAGNSGSSSATSFSTSTCSGGGSLSSSGTTGKPVNSKINSWTKITPGVVTIMKDFNKDLGIKEISIEVNNEAQNVKINVAKYTSKPAEVTKEKTGKVYQYLHINTENLEDKLSKGKITIKVEKTWLSENNLKKENVIVSKFDSTSGEWNDLTTSYLEADDKYEYYTAETNSFSYFAISEKVMAEAQPAETGIAGATEKIPEVVKNNYLWLLALVGVVAIIILVKYLISKKK
jgi:PGF-pre-PGF domain-containing protein